MVNGGHLSRVYCGHPKKDDEKSFLFLGKKEQENFNKRKKEIFQMSFAVKIPLLS